jgi:hypothetical protein
VTSFVSREQIHQECDRPVSAPSSRVKLISICEPPNPVYGPTANSIETTRFKENNAYRSPSYQENGNRHFVVEITGDHRRIIDRFQPTIRKEYS